jgi:dTDP-4-dehydrorhamnose reductase
MVRTLILGANGMLGSAVTNECSNFVGQVTATTRTSKMAGPPGAILWVQFDAVKDDLEDTFRDLPEIDFVINCIGVIKPHIDDSDPKKRANAVSINTMFPEKLEAWAFQRGIKVIQIATDCVFSGTRGRYVESDPHDAWDVYGKTKSLGEVPSSAMMHLRVSIIGPEVGRSTSLLEWIRHQNHGATITGFTDHRWNGITSLHFAKLARGIIESNSFVPGTHHVVPGDEVTKCDLVTYIADHYGRTDLIIEPGPSGKPIDRTLGTANQELNRLLWSNAGYSSPPTVEEMVSELPQ